MKRLFQQGMALCALLLLATSCLDIQESIYLRNNGSGKFALTVNLEDMESLLNLVTELSGEENAEEDFLAETELNFEKLKAKLEKLDGISQVKSIQENDNKLLGVAFEFSDIQALNNALQELNDTKEKPSPEFFAYRKNQLTRLNTLDVKEQVERKIETDIDISIDGVLLGNLLKDMSYTTKYTFEKPIKKASNPASKITNEGRTLTLTYYFFDEETSTNSLANNIHF